VQYTVGDAHTVLHVPAEHAVPGPQACPHVPQFALVVLRLVSQPFETVPSQLPQPAVHEAMPHVPPVQAGVPFAGVGQGLPHAPHAVIDVFKFTSQPFVELPSQFANPELHDAMPHAPATHDGKPFAGVGHACPHVPHAESVVLRFVSQPLVALASQLP
jgi:hypothetical protein